MSFSCIPAVLRWRLAALRGQCYFEQRKFLLAQQDFIYALHELPAASILTDERHHELTILHLQLAGTYRELQQLDAALDHYKTTLQMINSQTPLGYSAEAHWGIALIASTQVAQPLPLANSSLAAHTKAQEDQLRTALAHALRSGFSQQQRHEHAR
ncbi:hypothetical protein [Dictyobacter arantiisoli]|uniref:MalT-like TPR region domain-containing protein n=1 Tax=Dictyobacter arantiisoli TaxID=2014874 RepID=A0A5A5TIP1_9CHLR|nr:hypothetical protein [Dictyobacter arantiisoli]GCF10986.1 hypothetical protein KDI_45500 [Dictyobacter arantiisoli]